jgi:prefoldin subunit 5
VIDLTINEEQQGKELTELNEQSYNFPEYWERVHNQVDEIDNLIEQFNERTQLLESLTQI